MFKALKSLDFSEDQALAVGGAVEIARTPHRSFDREATIDTLCDGGFEERAAEPIADALRHCFVSEKVTAQYERPRLKTALVRGGMAAETAEAFLSALDGSVVTRRNAEVRRPITHPPSPGRVVMCDFTHLVKPEMLKERRAIVISSRLQSVSGRCTVVPVSKSPPRGDSSSYFKFEPGSHACFHRTDPVWAVCDHVYTVSLARLWRVNVNRRPEMPSISGDELAGIRSLVGTVLCGER
ncbi:type II toxin-antitoxin system PemK/MazF family toxin [Methylobacterium platani]|uniref:type II toxin-antitoxin system PemK/MazF family toxin n=1 Tax=Methylobacterium platani TaxID=427683 RepID=UPI0009E389A8|nr:type II toxin-antitoxin system PemK/MazF family toxin [Methylobacterium platani]